MFFTRFLLGDIVSVVGGGCERGRLKGVPGHPRLN